MRKIGLAKRIAVLMRELGALNRRLTAADGVVILRAEALKIERDDLVILSTSERLSENAAHRMKEQWKELARRLGIEDTKALVLEQGMTISILKPPPSRALSDFKQQFGE